MCYGVSMVRTQILLDAETYDLLRRAAAARRISASALVRETLRATLGGPTKGRRKRRYRFTFVGSLRGGPADLSERHDAALGEGDRW
jgi:hypothetical protein